MQNSENTRKNTPETTGKWTHVLLKLCKLPHSSTDMQSLKLLLACPYNTLLYFVSDQREFKLKRHILFIIIKSSKIKYKIVPCWRACNKNAAIIHFMWCYRLVQSFWKVIQKKPFNEQYIVRIFLNSKGFLAPRNSFGKK